MKRNIISTIIGVSAIAFSGFASAEYLDLTDWGINASGTGANSSDFHIVENVDIRGYSYVDTTVSDGTPSTFVDYGVLRSTVGYSADPTIPPSTLSDTFIARIGASDHWGGRYTPNATGTAADFNYNPGGTVNWTIQGSQQNLLTLNILEGTGDIDFVPSTGGEANGAVNIIFQITDVLPGYFFINEDTGYVDLFEILYDMDPNDPGFDIANKPSNPTMTPNDLYVGVTMMTNEFIGVNDPDHPTAVAQLAGLIGDGTSDSPYSSYTASTGYFRFAEKVPEPGMLSLMGLALLGLAGFQHKRNSKKH